MATITSLLARGAQIQRPAPRPAPPPPPDPRKESQASVDAALAMVVEARRALEAAVSATHAANARADALAAQVSQALTLSQLARDELLIERARCALLQQILEERLPAPIAAAPEPAVVAEAAPAAPEPAVVEIKPVAPPLPREIAVDKQMDRNQQIRGFVLKAAGREEVAIDVRRNPDGRVVDLVVRVPGESARVVPVTRDQHGHLRLVVNH